MLNLDQYREPSVRNDQIIQRALREIDSEPCPLPWWACRRPTGR
jgi:hypothetical protein